ncbi:MAG TPA: hypothetical protein VFM14_02935, partial [Gemmatimonadales bacterium]|nr:hypothetical protein [Gemmatimonadales bacterium]
LSLPPLPDPEGLRRAYVSAVSRQLLAGKLTPNEALDRVHRHAVSPLNHPADLAPWCFTWEGLDHTDYRTLTEAETADHARRLAVRWAGEKVWP